MAKKNFDEPTNPYHYALHCLGGKWKFTILHEIHTFGKIRFNQTLKVLPISEKVLSQQLKELINDGLVERIVDGSTFPPTIDYKLTSTGNKIIPAVDLLYIWSIREMKAKGIPIDADSFTVHKDPKYLDALSDIFDQEDFVEHVAHPHDRRK